MLSSLAAKQNRWPEHLPELIHVYINTTHIVRFSAGAVAKSVVCPVMMVTNTNLWLFLRGALKLVVLTS